METLKRLFFSCIYAFTVGFALGSIGCSGGAGLTPATETTADTQPPTTFGPAPTCTLVLSSNNVLVGASIQARLLVQGTVTESTLNGERLAISGGAAEKILNSNNAAGTFQVAGMVRGPGGQNSCGAQYTVSLPNAPQCTLAVPTMVSANFPVTAVLNVTGQVTSATIGTNSATLDNGVAFHIFTPTVAGNFTLSAQVTGPGGTNTCTSGNFQVMAAATAPSCTISKVSSYLLPGQPILFTLSVSGQATSSFINGSAVVPGVPFSVSASIDGSYTANGSVIGPGGQSPCQAVFNPPKCTLAASNITATSATLTMSLSGPISFAFIDGIAQSLPLPPANTVTYVKSVTPGNYTTPGFVANFSGDQATCQADYTVNAPVFPLTIAIPRGCYYVNHTSRVLRICSTEFDLTTYLPVNVSPSQLTGKTIRFNFRAWGYTGMAGTLGNGASSSVNPPPQSCAADISVPGAFGGSANIQSLLTLTGGTPANIDKYITRGVVYDRNYDQPLNSEAYYFHGVEYTPSNNHHVKLTTGGGAWGSCGGPGEPGTCTACLSDLSVTIE